ncbi:MAG TPA: hypothetical protein ENI23_15380 [bacterium]|nr:hypothetical protein [bacterium]
MVDKFRVVSTTTETRGRVKATVFTAETMAEAERLAKRASAALGRDTSIGIEEIKPGEPPVISKVIGPVPSKRGRTAQRRRERAERITSKAGRGETLSIDERRFIEGGSGRQPTKLEIRAAERIEARQPKRAERKAVIPSMVDVPTRQTLTTGGVPLTFLGIPQKLEVEPITQTFGFTPERPPSPQETIQLAPLDLRLVSQRQPTLFDIGGEITSTEFKPIEFTQELITEADLITLQRQAETMKTEKLTRRLAAGGVVALGAEFALGVKEVKEILPEAAGFGVLARVSPPAAGIVGTAALIGSVPALQESFLRKGVLRTLAREAPAIITFTAAGGAGARGRRVKTRDFLTVDVPKPQRFTELDLAKGKLTSVKVTGKEVETTLDVDLAALGLTTKQKATKGVSKVLSFPGTQPTATILSTSLFGGVDILPAVPIIFGRVKRGKAARKLSKAELRKQSFGQIPFQRETIGQRFTTKEEIGFRLRGEELKKLGIKERVIGVSPSKIRITEKGIGKSRAGLTTEFGAGEAKAKIIVKDNFLDIGLFKKVGEKVGTSFIEKGTTQKKFRKQFSQAETLRTVRQAAKETERLIALGKGTILVKPLVKEPGILASIGKKAKFKEPVKRVTPIEDLSKTIVTARSLELFKALGKKAKFKEPVKRVKPLKDLPQTLVTARSLELFKALGQPEKKIRFPKQRESKELKRIRQEALAQQQAAASELRGGFRPGIKERLFRQIQEREAQRRQQQELEGIVGVQPAEFGRGMFEQIGKVFGPKKKRKRDFLLIEQEEILRGLRPIEKGEVPTFAQLPTDIFTGATGPLGPARRLRQPRLSAAEKRRLKATEDLLQFEQPKLGIDLRTTTIPLLSPKLGAALGLLPAAGIGLKQFQDPIAATQARVDVLQIPAIDTSLDQAQEVGQDILQQQSLDKILALDTFQPGPGPRRPGPGPRRPGPREPVIRVPDIFVPEIPRTGRPGDPFFPDVGKPKEPREPIRPRTILGFDDIPGVTAAQQGFDVIVRQKGQDVKANTKSLPRNRAINELQDIIDNSAAASGRIRESKQPTDILFDDAFNPLGNKFRSPARKSKLPPKQFVEKNTFRIDSAGERAGITAKGLIARRKKAARSQALDFDFGGGMGL